MLRSSRPGPRADIGCPGTRGETIEDEPGVGDGIITLVLVLIWVMMSGSLVMTADITTNPRHPKLL